MSITLISTIFFSLMLAAIIVLILKDRFEEYIRYLIVGALIATPTFILNIGNSIYANHISIQNQISTFLFLFAWGYFGFVLGAKKRVVFISFAFSYWIVAAFLYWIGRELKSLTLLLFGLFNFIPLYGLSFYIKDKSKNIALFILPLAIGLLGYYVAAFRAKKHHNV